MAEPHQKTQSELEEEEVEKYRRLLDETILNLGKLYEVRSRKADRKMVALGIALVGLGGVLIIYIPSLDIHESGAVSLFGAAGIFLGISVAFIGYLLAHKGFIGHWR
jgi:hypothetical protein